MSLTSRQTHSLCESRERSERVAKKMIQPINHEKSGIIEQIMLSTIEYVNIVVSSPQQLLAETSKLSP